MKKLIVLLYLLPAVTESFHAYTPQDEVVAHLYTDVQLSCFFSLSKEDPTLKHVIVFWKHNGVEIARFIDKKVTNSHMALLTENDLRNGNASLHLRNITVEYEGEYEWLVYETPLQLQGKVQLKVLGSPTVSLMPLLLVMNYSGTLECRAEGFYPRNISIEWLRNSEPIDLQELLDYHNNPDGTFSAKRRYNYTSTDEDIEANVSCKVTHESLQKDLVEHLHTCKLKVSPTTLLSGEDQTITCKLNDCLNRRVDMRWRKNDMAWRELECEVVKECLCKATFIAKDTDGKGQEEEQKNKILCEAEMEGLERLLTECIPITIQDGSKRLHWAVTCALILTAPLVLTTLLIVLCRCLR
ncbi:tyrosine-protein phosphatase non-receptor type substrate 1-like isoform X1 [Polypterus senegalus]|uniref:tyrosine-protein phosphatase non-receptor type substrate 1-like isoform X1 n=1 Tax=Polypterus senegalus TaxID=55291 RepID=UPI001964ED6B|nr:tyrosine-protein phosphatase non-receptor type substrate 1-like isoform X1 [Polypterus senegalus]